MILNIKLQLKYVFRMFKNIVTHKVTDYKFIVHSNKIPTEIHFEIKSNIIIFFVLLDNSKLSRRFSEFYFMLQPESLRFWWMYLRTYFYFF